MHDGRDSAKGQAHLYTEHLLLGAAFEESRIVDHYHAEPDAEGVWSQLHEGAVLCDVSDALVLLLSGGPVTNFAEAAFAGRRLRVGECSFEAALTGDGSVASVPLLARTGQAEYVCGDLSVRSDVLEAWLGFLGSVSNEGVAPFEGMEQEDASGTHAAMLLWGRASTDILADYVASRADLPAAGRVVSCMLDRLPCIVLRPDLGREPAYVVLVPPAHAIALWRSLLSFTEVTPLGRSSLRSLVHRSLPWTAQMRAGDSVRMSASELKHAGLVRSDSTYVGARGLTNGGKGSVA